MDSPLLRGRSDGATPQGLPYFAPPRPRVLAHRGFVGPESEVPENTLLAFLKALALGVGYLELDVRASRDGVAVVSHDADLVRLGRAPVRVCDLSLDELRRFDLGAGQRICSLREVLDAFPDARLNIDLKSADAVKPAAVAVRLAGARDRVLLTSFSERRRRAAAKLLPGVASSASASRVLIAVLAGKIGATAVMKWSLRGVGAMQVPVKSAGLTIATRRLVRQLHAIGIEMHIWTINDRATMERLLDIGIDGLVTDRSDVAVRLVEERSAQHR